MRNLALLSVIAALALIAARGWLVYPELPATVASHFNGAGEADGWSSKARFFQLMGAVLALLVGTGLGIPLLLAVIPTRWVNLPHRDYWLAPERAAHTRAVIQTYLAWFHTATLGLMAWILELTYRANLSADGATRLSNHVWTALGAYLLFTGAWLVFFLRRFQR